MDTIHFLAQLFGYSLIIIPLSLLLKPKRIKSILQLMESEIALFMHGMIRMVLGIAALLSYHIWDTSWKVLVTILGYVLVISGGGMLFLPELAKKMIVKLKNSDWVLALLVVLVLIGCFLLYFSFS